MSPQRMRKLSLYLQYIGFVLEKEAELATKSPKKKCSIPTKEALSMHPAITHVLKYFAYGHLPPKLQDISRPFSELAKAVAERSPDNQETTVALRKLLEAKDAAVRAAL